MAAFALLVGVAALAIGNDLRVPADDVLVERSAPKVLLGALGPDMVISSLLRSRSVSRDQERRGAFGPTSVDSPVRTYALPDLFDETLPPSTVLTPAASLTSSATGLGSRPLRTVAVSSSVPNPSNAESGAPAPTRSSGVVARTPALAPSTSGADTTPRKTPAQTSGAVVKTDKSAAKHQKQAMKDQAKAQKKGKKNKKDKQDKG
ncbi:MAG: hypothetical protein ABIN79_12155 [Marmoricola sp.]